jgi:hypothetical protein
MMLLAVRWYMKFDKRTKKIIRDMLANIDLKKIELDEADRCYAAGRTEYKFKFMKE